ncbi:MAG: hypothetical protein EOP45_06780 [Sphingobacteriaceae bacterium]|nr:MAG: hypothetical protein EOP45_06780 [Sphingobacteriaceae bacterium]
MMLHHQCIISTISTESLLLQPGNINVLLTNEWKDLAPLLHINDQLNLLWKSDNNDTTVPNPFTYNTQHHIIVHPSIVISPSMIQSAQKCMYATLFKERFGMNCFI